MNNNDLAIGFDARPLYRKRDGIGTYVEQTMLAASKLYPSKQFIGIIFKGDDMVECSIKKLPSNIKIVVLPFRWKYYRALAEINIWKPIDKYVGLPLSDFIYFNYTALPWLSDKVNKKLLVHDATYILYPETVSKKNLVYLSKYVAKSLAKKHVKGYTLSKHSAQLLQKNLGNNFTVASPGPSPLKFKITDRNPDGSLLFIGTIEPRKNLANLVTGYSALDKAYQSRHPLIIAGREGWGNTKIDTIIEDNKQIKRVVSPSDSELSDLYCKASCYVMPSTYEGFGIPVLDAAIFGIPVITSIDSPMQEILGTDGAIYVDPASVESIKNGLISFGEMNSKKIETLLKNSHHHINGYTWENTAKALFADDAKNTL